MDAHPVPGTVPGTQPWGIQTKLPALLRLHSSGADGCVKQGKGTKYIGG